MEVVDCSNVADPSFETACESTCGNSFAHIYYPLFIFIAVYILLNLIVAVLFKTLGRLGKKQAKGGKGLITNRSVSVVFVFRA